MAATLFQGATLIDCTGADPRPDTSILVEDWRITRTGAGGAIAAPDGARVVDCRGLTLMPGLTDAHVHFAFTQHPAEPPQSLVSYVLRAKENAEIALQEGFTTVRDAGGLDPAFALAVEAGQIAGPRILPSGSFLSITGGHGDQRHRWTDHHEHAIPGLLAATEIVDGADAVRRAARTQIRRGATQVKLMVSGGVMSPNDPIDSLQFSVPEIRAAVEEARAFGKYVMAHTHTSEAMQNALEGGVRSLEHASILDRATAGRIAAQSAFVVPTLVILDILARSGEVPAFSREKLERVRGEVAHSVATAKAAGVQIGSGSDLLGPRQRRRASEIVVKAEHLGPMEALVSATRTNAALFGLEERIGTVEAGKDADVILVRGDPLADPGLLAGGEHVVLVMQRGAVVKETL